MPETQEMSSDKKPNYIVGVGASAGGLGALERLFKNMPPETGMAFVVIQHLSPDYKSYMAQLLARHTSMPTLKVEDGMEALANHVYLIPPSYNLKIFQGKLLLINQPTDRSLNLPIDVFFNSLAQDCGRQSIGIVLSGTGSDGTAGIRSIKDAGGMVVAQSECTAEFDGMPRSAINTGLADFVLAPEKMPEELVRFIQHPYISREKAILRNESSTETLMGKIFSLLRDHGGVDFSQYKPSTIDRRIERRISVNRLSGLDEYYTFLSRSVHEREILENEFLICVTSFFRDPDAFEALRKEALIPILNNTPAEETIRIWVAGCATGEEAYSIAILLDEVMHSVNQHNEVKIFATDISSSSIKTASAGSYNFSEVAQLSPARINHYFDRVGDGFRLKSRIRRMVIFAEHNLLADPPFNKLDLICCRNVLIYFQNSPQQQTLSNFTYSLKRKGFIFLGPSEILGELSNFYDSVSQRFKIFQKRTSKGAKSIRIPTPTGISSRTNPVTPELTFQRRSPRGLLHGHADEIYREIIEINGPACAIIDENDEVLHLLGGIQKFLRLPEGGFSGHLLKLADRPLATALATALHKFKMTKELEEFVYDNVCVEQHGAKWILRIRISSLRIFRHTPRMRLVIIEKKNEAPLELHSGDEEIHSYEEQSRIEELEQELNYTKESLQATVEELETSNEELQAANEELLASNEELQSSNEELQSVNEELHTVNAENQSRINELVELTNDINNLLAISRVSTMIVDGDLRIRKMSIGISDILGIKDDDNGAPLEIISRSMDFPNILEMAKRVIHRRKEEEIIVSKNHDSPNILIRMIPYRKESGLIHGLILTAVEVPRKSESPSLK